MAEENIDIAKFDFNVDDVVRSATILKKEIDSLKKSQSQLKKDGKSASAQYVEQEASIKALNGEYKRHIKALTDTAKQAQDNIVREKLLDTVLGKEVNTIKEAREQNKLLNKLRNDANIGTEEGQEQIKRLNAQLDRNNELIKENVDAYTAQKINIGNYKNDIMEALSAQNLLSGGTSGLKSAFATAAKGVVAFTKASLAFIATPVGAVITALVVVFLLIKNAMDRNEESMNKLKKAFAPFQGIIDAVMGALEPLGEFLIDNLVKGFELLEQGVYTLIDSLSVVLDFLGFEDAAESVRGFNEMIQEGAQNAKDLADAEAQLEKSQRKARLTQLQYMKEAEQFRQIRDDETRTIAERIQANESLGKVLEQQLQDELAIAQQALLVANLRAKAEGESSAILDAQASALEEIADIEERINGQRSEQLVNRNALLKEAEDARQKAIDKQLKDQEEAIALYIAEAGIRARTLAEEIALEREISQQRRDLLDDELKHKRISQAEYQAEILNMQNERAFREAELLAENASRELEIERKKNQAILDEGGFLTEEKALRQLAAQQEQFLRDQEFFQLQLEQGLLNQNDFDAAIAELKEVNRLAQEEIRLEREATEKAEALELRALEFEEEMARMIEEGATRFEIETAMIEEQKATRIAALEEEREQGLISEELYNARRAQIDREAKAAEAQRDQILADQKVALISAGLNAAAGLVDKNSAAGKAIAVAQAGINTFQGVTGAIAATPGPVGIAMGAIVGAVGALNIAKIIATKVPSAKGTGTVGGGAGGGGASTKGVGGVNIGGKGVNLTSSGASQSAAVQQQIEQNSGRKLNEGIERAVREGSAQGTEQGTNTGMTNLSDNRAVAEESTF